MCTKSGKTAGSKAPCRGQERLDSSLAALLKASEAPHSLSLRSLFCNLTSKAHTANTLIPVQVAGQLLTNLLVSSGDFACHTKLG